MSFNTQAILRELNIPLGTTIPLPYGLMLEVGLADNLEDLCTNDNELKALGGLLEYCGAAIITLTEASLLPICSVVVLVNERLGVLISYRDRGILQYLSANNLPSPELFINEGIEQLGITQYLNNLIPGIPMQYIPFEELVPLWYKIINSKMIYVL